MAPGRAEPGFGLQGWIDALALKQIFLIYSEELDTTLLAGQFYSLSSFQ